LTTIGCISQIVRFAPFMLSAEEAELADKMRLLTLQIYLMGQKGLGLDEYVSKTVEGCDWCEHLLSMLDPELGDRFYEVVSKWT